MGHQQPIRPAAAAPNPDIPDKLYFRIGEVGQLCQVPAYVLRFWESEFPQLKPNKGGTGQRLYRRRDVEMALRIKRLLYDEGYTIPGARQVFKAEAKHRTEVAQLPLPSTPPNPSGLRALQTLRKELQEIATLLSRPVQPSASLPHTTSRQNPPSPAAVRSLRNPRRAHAPFTAAAPLTTSATQAPRDTLFIFAPIDAQSDSEV